jgi:type IV pilus assembly protein PilA
MFIYFIHYPFIPLSTVKAFPEKLTKLTKKDGEGFTLIELMIVIAIIGILAAIAIPQFSVYRTRSYNSAARSDLRNAVTSQEAYFVDNSTYCGTEVTLTGGTYRLYLSDRVVFTIVSALDKTYVMKSCHPSGSESYIIRGPGGSISKF